MVGVAIAVVMIDVAAVIQNDKPACGECTTCVSFDTFCDSTKRPDKESGYHQNLRNRK